MNRTRCNIFLLALALLSFACNNKKEATEFTLMTYNIYHGEQTYKKGHSNIDDIAAVINKYKPDFVALQEVDSMTQRTAGFNDGEKKDLAKELAKRTGMHGYFAKAIDYSEGGYGEGLLSRWPVTVQREPLSAPLGGEERAVIISRYEYAPGKELIFAGTHLCHEHRENREAQATALRELFKDNPLPVILAGDLNFTDTTKAYKILETSWKDAAVVFGDPKNTIPFVEPRKRIDYVLLSKNSDWEVTDVQVIPVGHSDHMPVLVKVKLSE